MKTPWLTHASVLSGRWLSQRRNSCPRWATLWEAVSGGGEGGQHGDGATHRQRLPLLALPQLVGTLDAAKVHAREQGRQLRPGPPPVGRVRAVRLPDALARDERPRARPEENLGGLDGPRQGRHDDHLGRQRLEQVVPAGRVYSEALATR